MIERVEIDGRKAQVIYLDEDMQPIEKEQAVLIKVLFEDGEMVVLDAAQK